MSVHCPIVLSMFMYLIFVFTCFLVLVVANMYSCFVAFFIHINIGVGDPMTKREKLTPSYCCA